MVKSMYDAFDLSFQKTEIDTKVLHKRITSKGTAFQLCSQREIQFRNWSYRDKYFKHWALKEARSYWRLVTCAICLDMKESK